MEHAIILDLDNTIFPTRSMDPAWFTPFFTFLETKLEADHPPETVSVILREIWDKPWDHIIRVHGVKRRHFEEAIAILDQGPELPPLQTYVDYAFLKTLPNPRFLVTTSATAIQQKKISALGIGKDFTKIVINDPFRDKKQKLDIFRELMGEFGLVPQKTYVIGDSAESEMKAGHALDMITIQVLKEDVKRSEHAHFHIRSFEELDSIIPQQNTLRG
jgi:FMN phosphatase YigB (HAD superfamily)